MNNSTTCLRPHTSAVECLLTQYIQNRKTNFVKCLFSIFVKIPIANFSLIVSIEQVRAGLTIWYHPIAVITQHYPISIIQLPSLITQHYPQVSQVRQIIKIVLRDAIGYCYCYFNGLQFTPFSIITQQTSIKHTQYLLLNHKRISYQINVPINLITICKRHRTSLPKEMQQSCLLAMEEQYLKIPQHAKIFKMSCYKI